MVSLAVVAAWYLSGNIRVDSMDGQITLATYYDQWDMMADSEAGRTGTRGVRWQRSRYLHQPDRSDDGLRGRRLRSARCSILV